MKPNNETVALICITAIVIIAIVFKLPEAKDIALALGGGLTGWMTRTMTEKA
jgi:hypothetical protein